MNKIQSNHFRMFLSLQAYLDSNATVWQGIPRIVNYKISFDEVLSRIQSKIEVTNQGAGVTQQKEQLKEVIAGKASMLSGILYIVAMEQNNKDLADDLKMSRTEILRLKEADIDATVKKVSTYATQNIEILADFGITQEVVTELISTVDDFNVLIGKPRTILSQKYAALNSIEELFDEGNNLLKLKIDNAMVIFRDLQTEFYEGYQNARVIIDN